MDETTISKSELAYQFLLSRLIEAKILPEAPLRIQALGTESGLGVTPMREALRRLESERFVVMENNRGFRAAAVTHEELADLENSRLVVESALLSEAIRYGDDDWEAHILSAHHMLKKAVDPTTTEDFDELRTWAARHRNFHNALLGASRTRWLNRFYSQITNHLDRHFFSMFTGPGRAKYLDGTDLLNETRSVLGIEHHTRLMDAALDRNMELAYSILAEHVGFTRAFFDRVEAKE
ncbi:GntR family transcriptional regulator [Falsihalocynthiibacter sp. SS001]|uniref:GntR family transcriptional regulator n=1 Tax=Falsihalocynthiibacter sp. SS001 TaxID=3349698 RepID=UPI0036D26684